jgi:hypothetical protein
MASDRSQPESFTVEGCAEGDRTPVSLHHDVGFAGTPAYLLISDAGNVAACSFGAQLPATENRLY